VSATAQCGHWQTWPHFGHCSERANPRRLRNRIDCSPFSKRCSSATRSLSDRIAGRPCVSPPPAHVHHPHQRHRLAVGPLIEAQQSYLPVCALCHDSSEGVAEPNTIAQGSNAARSTATSRP
jgi:hypothetical protein